MIDTHCHLTYRPLLEQLDQVLARADAAGVPQTITVGTSIADSRQAATLAEDREGVYATVGVHPHEADKCLDQSSLEDMFRALTAHPKVVALGEMGLDRHYPDPPIESQRRVLQWQLDLAAKLPDAGPIVIHNREATDEILGQLEDSGIPGSRFVFHCFTGDEGELESILEFGAMVSFTGIVTFKNARALAAASDRVPLDRLMVETDAPYLTPEPHRKVRPNEPCYVPFVARFFARYRDMEEKDLVAALDGNARRFFRLS